MQKRMEGNLLALHQKLKNDRLNLVLTLALMLGCFCRSIEILPLSVGIKRLSCCLMKSPMCFLKRAGRGSERPPRSQCSSPRSCLKGQCTYDVCADRVKGVLIEGSEVASIGTGKGEGGGPKSRKFSRCLMYIPP